MTADAGSPAGKRSAALAGFTAGLFLLYLVQVAAGLVLEARYHAVAGQAYVDVRSLQHGDLAVVRAAHYWSSMTLIVGSFVGLIWMFFTRWFNGGHTRIWFATALLFLTAELSQITGNVLPYDRHGVQTAVIETGVARRTPIVGTQMANALTRGEGFNASTIGMWHFLHLGLSVLGLAAIVLFWLSIRRERKSPWLAGLPLVAAAALALSFAAPLGLRASPSDYGSYDAQVSWYTWPLHGSLNLWSRVSPALGWIGSVVFPGAFALFILAAPFLSKRTKGSGLRIVLLAFLAYFLTAGSFFGGRFAPLVGNRDPVLSSHTNAPSRTPVDPKLYAQGRQLFNTNACMGCHGKDGQNGDSGPNLLEVSKRRGTDPAWYMGFIRNPQTVKPNTMMPAFPELSDGERRAIAEFLIHQKP